MIRNFLDRGTAALLTVLPDRHDVIECISTASQFYILEAIKVVLNKPIDHFHLRLLLTLLPWAYPLIYRFLGGILSFQDTMINCKQFFKFS